MRIKKINVLKSWSEALIFNTCNTSFLLLLCDVPWKGLWLTYDVSIFVFSFGISDYLTKKRTLVNDIDSSELIQEYYSSKQKEVL